MVFFLLSCSCLFNCTERSSPPWLITLFAQFKFTFLHSFKCVFGVPLLCSIPVSPRSPPVGLAAVANLRASLCTARSLVSPSLSPTPPLPRTSGLGGIRLLRHSLLPSFTDRAVPFLFFSHITWFSPSQFFQACLRVCSASATTRPYARPRLWNSRSSFSAFGPLASGALCSLLSRSPVRSSIPARQLPLPLGLRRRCRDCTFRRPLMVRIRTPPRLPSGLRINVNILRL